MDAGWKGAVVKCFILLVEQNCLNCSDVSWGPSSLTKVSGKPSIEKIVDNNDIVAEDVVDDREN